MRIVGILSVCYIIVTLLVWQFSHWYVSELRLSFLPYRMWGGILWSLLLMSICFGSKSKRRRHIFCWLVLLSLVCVGRYRRQYRWFYTDDEGIYQEGEWLSFLYANVYYKNTDHSGLLDMIDLHDPDVLLLVEYSPQWHMELAPILEELYPYMNYQQHEHIVWGRIVYSKYPLENLSLSLTGSSAWRYGYVSIATDARDYVFYLVHTSAPTNTYYFDMRAEQLEQLQQDIMDHSAADLDDPLITIIGDFNLTPWSHAYDTLEQTWSPRFTNLTRRFPWMTTRSLLGNLGPYAHIDHVRTDIPDDRLSLEQIKILGSDHRGFLGKIRN